MIVIFLFLPIHCVVSDLTGQARKEVDIKQNAMVISVYATQHERGKNKRRFIT
jgi:hypothetical protein